MFSYASESHMVNHQREELFMLKPAKTLINIGCHISGGWEDSEAKREWLILVSIIYTQFP